MLGYTGMVVTKLASAQTVLGVVICLAETSPSWHWNNTTGSGAVRVTNGGRLRRQGSVEGRRY